MLLSACGAQPDADQSVADHGQAASEHQKVDWYQDDLSEPVQKAGLADAGNIMAAAHLKPTKIIDSTDPQGEPKKIYQFQRNGIALHAQLEHSPNQVLIGWYQADDAVESSQNTLRDAYKLARAALGQDGAAAVRRISGGSSIRNEQIAGESVSGSCIGNQCTLKIES